MREFSIDYEDVYIHAREEMPDECEKSDKANARMPLAIVVHGLTGSMDEQQLLSACDAAHRAGMASLQIELFGHGKSGGDFYYHTVSKWVSQIEFIYDYVAKQERFSDIYLIGHSQGGLASLLAAARIEQKEKSRLKALVLMAPAVCIVTNARSGRFFDTTFDAGNIPENVSFWEAFTVGGGYIKDAMKLPLEESVHSFKKPVLIVHGTKDESVNFNDSTILVKEYENATLVPIEGDLHCFDYKHDEMADVVQSFLEIMDKTVSVRTMRLSDAWTIQNMTASKELMLRAGQGIYDAGLEKGLWKGPVAIVCGKGNNAGDGFVVADIMRRQNIECEIVLLSDDFSEDGKYYYDIAINDGVISNKYSPDIDFGRFGSILDCIFGTGFKGDVTGNAREAIEKINAARENGAYVISADINSGINGDSGRGACYVKSDLTVSVGSFKHGHFLGNADKAMKDKVNVDIGIKII